MNSVIGTIADVLTILALSGGVIYSAVRLLKAVVGWIRRRSETRSIVVTSIFVVTFGAIVLGLAIQVTSTVDELVYLQHAVAAQRYQIDELKRGHAGLSISAFESFDWRQGRPPQRMIRKSEGICYLSFVTGNFNGDGEVVRVVEGEDGFWYLSGASQKSGVAAKATCWTFPSLIQAEGGK